MLMFYGRSCYNRTGTSTWRTAPWRQSMMTANSPCLEIVPSISNPRCQPFFTYIEQRWHQLPPTNFPIFTKNIHTYFNGINSNTYQRLWQQERTWIRESATCKSSETQKTLPSLQRVKLVPIVQQCYRRILVPLGFGSGGAFCLSSVHTTLD